jgi:DNA-binding NtrC family response regulator
MTALPQQPESPSCIIGVSRAMKEVLDLIGQVAGTRVNVMIYGRRGTEKKLLAKTIHNRSTRADKPFFEIGRAHV